MRRFQVPILAIVCLVTALVALPLTAQQEEVVEQAKEVVVEKAKEMATEKAEEAVMEKAQEMVPEEKQVPGGEAPEMSPEMAAMMEAWQKAMTPGEAHAELEKLVGTWKATIKSWMDPAAEPMVTEGKIERAMILGGRVLEEKLTSSFQGMPFEGIGMNGYDNVTGEHWSVWFDNMSTGNYVMRGTADDAGVVTFRGAYDDPMTGGKMSVRSVMRTEGDERQVFEWYEDRGEGEIKTMEIVYERQAM